MSEFTRPEVGYAKSGRVHVAYQVFGEGRINIVHTPGSVSHLEYNWDQPGVRRYLEKLGTFARVAIFDKRGTGLSDRDASIPTFEERMDEIRAVMDTAGFEQAVLLGFSEGVPMSILFAATHPSRTKGLVLYGGEAKGTWSPDYPWQATREQREQSIAKSESIWGTKDWVNRIVSGLAPSGIGDEKFTSWFGDMFRSGSSPGASTALSRSEMNMDVRNILPAIHVPTLVIHLTGDLACDVEEGRYIASKIPGSKYLELPGVDHFFYVNPTLVEKVTAAIREFVGELEPLTATNRVLMTVVFTDIVDSTKMVAEMGDEAWYGLLEKHNLLVREEVRRYNGSIIKNTGDGVLATFDGPTRALNFAWNICRSADHIGIKVRVGVHTGECVIGPNDVSGIAIHIASRVMDTASPMQVLVTGTVKDLVYGSGITFANRGERELKGVEGKRQLFSVEDIS